MKLYLIRHFKTQGNIEKRYIGMTDEPLAEGEEHKAFYPPVSQVVASPMKRCLQTADKIYPGCEPICCEELKECDFGLFEGGNYKELKDLEAYRKWLDSRGMLPFPGGEEHAAFKERCVSGFRKMVDVLCHSGCEHAAMVVHGGTIMAILEQFDTEKREFYHWQVKNGEGYAVYLNEVDWQQGNRYLTEIEKL